MIKVKVNGTNEKVVLEGTVGMTVAVEEVNDYDMENYWMGTHYEAYFVDFDCYCLRAVILDRKEDAEIDCDEKVYEKWMNEVRKPYIIKQALDKHHNECEKVAKGKIVKVVRGRKVPIGVKGEVFWMGEVNYDPYKRDWNWEWKLGIKGEDGETYWTYERNVEVADPTAYYEDEKVIAIINERIEKGDLR